MIKKLIGTLALSVLFAVQANAATMTITGPSGDVMVGNSFDLQIWGDFTGQGLIAGGITLLWDSALVALDNIVLNLDVVDDFSCPGSVNCPPNTADSAPIVWGEFLADLIDPADPAPTLMATLSFTAISATAETLAFFDMIDNPNLTGGWFGAGFTPIDTPEFVGTSVNVVPLPAAVWFMIGGLGTLLGFRRK